MERYGNHDSEHFCNDALKVLDHRSKVKSNVLVIKSSMEDAPLDLTSQDIGLVNSMLKL
jgi:hypothetical protein